MGSPRYPTISEKQKSIIPAPSALAAGSEVAAAELKMTPSMVFVSRARGEKPKQTRLRAPVDLKPDDAKKWRRKRASDRELQRIHELAHSTEVLRRMVPQTPDEDKASKVKLLRQTASYIELLREMVDSDNEELFAQFQGKDWPPAGASPEAGDTLATSVANNNRAGQRAASSSVGQASSHQQDDWDRMTERTVSSGGLEKGPKTRSRLLRPPSPPVGVCSQSHATAWVAPGNLCPMVSSATSTHQQLAPTLSSTSLLSAGSASATAEQQQQQQQQTGVQPLPLLSPPAQHWTLAEAPTAAQHPAVGYPASSNMVAHYRQPHQHYAPVTLAPSIQQPPSTPVNLISPVHLQPTAYHTAVAAAVPPRPQIPLPLSMAGTTPQCSPPTTLCLPSPRGAAQHHAYGLGCPTPVATSPTVTFQHAAPGFAQRATHFVQYGVTGFFAPAVPQTIQMTPPLPFHSSLLNR